MTPFGKAFAEARKAGLKEFIWQGKPYHTKTKEEMVGDIIHDHPPPLRFLTPIKRLVNWFKKN